jgi:uncharacterized protein (TIRG00374 family)
MEKKKRTSILRFVYIGATILVIALIGFFTVDVAEMEAAFSKLNLRWMFACAGCLVLYWLTDAILLNDIVSYMYKRESFWHSLKVGIIGLYYGALTPFATGGQPMQVVYMRRSKMPVGTATCIVGVKFVVYELSLCALFIAAIVLYGPQLYREYGGMFWFALLGFAVNASAVFFIIMTLINKNLVTRMGNSLIRFFSKVKIIRKPEKAQHSFEHTINDYHLAAEYIAHHKLRAIGSFFISVVNLLFFFAIPYFIYIAFGMPGNNAIQNIIALQAFLYIAISFVPTPGSAFAAEGGFHAVFSAIFGAGAVFAPMLIWRFLTYYLMLIVGSIVVVFDEVLAMRRAAKSIEIGLSEQDDSEGF